MDQSKGKHNQEEASEDKEVDSDRLCSTKQCIKQCIEPLYEESVIHEEELAAQKTMQKENEENGKLAAIQIHEAAASSSIPLVWMSLLMLVLTDNCFKLRDPNNSSSDSNSYLRYHVKINVKWN